jgi:hypothetical protein
MDLNPNYCECDNKKSYSEEYDCYYCESCNKWSEDKCDDPTCEFCIKRPVTPKE